MPLCLKWIVLASSIYLISAQQGINLDDYLQPNRIAPQQFASRNLCARKCVAGEPPRICYYKWIAEDYVTLGPACGNCSVNNPNDCNAPQCVVANGYEKTIKTINRMMPGPSIEVCLRDRIIVDVTNNMQGAQLSIHWHGVWQQGTQYMDGVPMVTQCSINEGDTFRYDFLANNAGTHYWHSHDGLQKLDGIEGNLVIRDPNDLNRNEHDVDDSEHVIMIMDWMNTTADERFPGTTNREPGQLPTAFLLNGRGRPIGQPSSRGSIMPPYPEVWIDSGRRTRLRLVGGLCTVCGVEFRIEGHDMTLIATDGASINPVKVNSVILFSGERYDVVINGNRSPGTYWIHLRGLAECSPATGEAVYQVGVLRYRGTNQARRDEPGYFPSFRGGVVANPQNASCANGQGGVCVSQLVGRELDTQNVLSRRPDHNIPITFGFHLFLSPGELFNNGQYKRYLVASDKTALTAWVNNISYVSAPSPIISQGQELPQSIFCPFGANGYPQCPSNAPRSDYCECVYVIKVGLGEVVQLVLGDSSPVFDLHHPFHLHGYDFYVMAIDQFKNGENLQSITQKLYDTNFRKSQNPAKKDTVAVPSNGYAAIRFKADNPGLWFFHCHFMYHLATGMALVIQVGENGDWPPIPNNFPRCGNYQPGKFVQEYFTMQKWGRFGK